MINYILDYSRRVRVCCFHRIFREKKNKELFLLMKEMNHNVLAINSLISSRDLSLDTDKATKTYNLKELSEIYSILYAKMKAKINNSIMCILFLI